MRPARSRFARASGWEPDYSTAGRPGLMCGYRGPFLTETESAQRALRRLSQDVAPADRGGASLVIKRAPGCDRLVVCWTKDRATRAVGARLVEVEGLRGWHLEFGVAVPGPKRSSDLHLLVRTLVREEPLDFVSTTQASLLNGKAFGRLSPTRSVLHDGPFVRALQGALGMNDESVLTVADISGSLSTRANSARPSDAMQRVAVTGTNGKTSCVELGRQLLEATGHQAASFGTLGVTTNRGRNRAGRIGPGSAGLPRLADRLWALGVDSLWAEAFSNALAKGLLDRFAVDVAIFTQFGVDHQSVHGSLAGYWAAKERLFNRVLRPEGTVVLNPLADGAERVLAIAQRRGLDVVTTGPGQRVELVDDELWVDGQQHPAPLPFTEAIMVSNLELVIGAAVAMGVPADELAAGIGELEFPPGRFMEVEIPAPFRLVIEAAHNGDALQVCLEHWRKQTRGRLLVLLASVGSSDPERWEPFAEVADVLGDIVVVTDESPYRGDASLVRDGLMRGCPRANEIPDRHEAIAWLLGQAQPEDVVMLMGRADEAFVVGSDGAVPFPTDESIVRSILGT